MMFSRAIAFDTYYSFWERAAVLGMPNQQPTRERLAVKAQWFESRLEHRTKTLLTNILTTDLTRQGQPGPLNGWRSLVGQYSRRNLTVASDILPAISGVASEIQGRFHYTYLHWLWKEDLQRGLLW
jgi:hypothetical protein